MEIKFALIFLATICATQVFGACAVNDTVVGDIKVTIDYLPPGTSVYFLGPNEMTYAGTGTFECETKPCYFSGYSAEFKSYTSLGGTLLTPSDIC